MKKIISLILMLAVLLTILTASVATGYATTSKEYEDEFVTYLQHLGYGPAYEGDEWWYMYSSGYKYFSDTNITDTPDWVMSFCASIMVEPMPCYGVFGDYYIYDEDILIPNALGYYIYVPSEEKFYTLEQAYSSEIEGIEKVFTEYLLVNGKARYIGDVDGDKKLTVLDATLIQRAIAGLCDFPSSDELSGMKVTNTPELEYVSDISRDGERNVLDATIIQKKVANIEA